LFVEIPHLFHVGDCLIGFLVGASLGAVLVLLSRRRVAACSIAAVHRERWRIARELHDTVGHRLLVIALQVRALRLGGERVEVVASAVEEEARLAQRDIRRTIGVLRGIGVGSEPLSTSITDLGARLPSGQLSVCLDNVAAERSLRPELREAALRIVQEGVTNAVKHGSGQIRVALTFGDPLAIEVTNGAVLGDAPGPVGVAGGYGLIGLRERVATLGGAFTCGPVAGGGFVVRAQLPVDGYAYRKKWGTPVWVESES
jgi:signal transduction histidine kinase